MRKIITILFLTLSNFVFSQGTISGKIFLPQNWTSPLPKIAVYRSDTTLLETILTVNSLGNFTYTYPAGNTTYHLEPYFDSFDTSKVSTLDATQILQESLLIDAPNKVDGLNLQTGVQWYSSDVKNQKKLDAGQGYLVLRKDYYKTYQRTYRTISEMICNGSFEVNNPGSGSYSIYPLTANMCWKSLNEQFLEVWGFNFLGIIPYNGATFIEMNVNSANSYYQDFIVSPNDSLSISFAHRSRAASEQVILRVGPVNGTQTTLRTSTLTPSNGWVYYTDGHKIPANPTNLTYRVTLISNTGGGGGNLLDAVSVRKFSTTSTSYLGPKIDFFTESEFSQLSKSNWKNFQSKRFFPVVVTNTNQVINFKYIVRGNTQISSTL